MRSLEELLEDLGQAVEEREINRWAFDPQTDTQETALTIRQHGSNSVSVNSMQTPQTVMLKDCPKTKMQVTDILLQCWKTLRLYGSKDDNFIDRSDVMLNRLGSYPAQAVIGAFEKYIDRCREFPTPADIIGILDGRIKPDRTFYTRLVRKIDEGELLTKEEYAYVCQYERQVLDSWE